VSLTLPRQAVVELASRRRRFHHYLWHRVRDSWAGMPPARQQAVRDINPAWEPPRPALDAAHAPLRDNDSGEDFLYMQRQMLIWLNETLARAGQPGDVRVEAWRRVPPPDDTDYPVPPFPDSGLEEVKSVEYFEQVTARQEERYKSLDYLRGVTLGELGSDIEFTIHGDVHMRWAAPSPVGYRPPTIITGQIAPQWDEPDYDYLGDTYSCHVNPIFWRLLGWEEKRVEDWKRAHGIDGEIEWKGMWMGPPIGRARDEPRSTDNEMSRIDRIISESHAGPCDGFFRPTPRGDTRRGRE
jgi:hypothetical protein